MDALDPIMIRATGLGRRFGELWAIRNMDLDVRRGEVLGLLGPNGAGKTTTVRLLTALIEPSEGLATVDGFDVVTEADVVRKAVGDRIDPAAMAIGSLVTSPLLDIDLNRSIRDACDVMARNQVRHLAVRDQSKIVGVISLRDLVKMVAARDTPEFLHRSSADRQGRGS